MAVAAEEVAVEAEVAELGEEVRGVAVAPEEEAIARLPGVGAERQAAHDPGEAARGLAEAGVVEAAPVPVVAADFVAELPVALEAAEGLVAVREAESVVAIDRQLCHLVGMSLGTDRAALAAPEVLGIGRVALVGLVELQIGPVVSVDREALQIDPVASVDRVASEIVRVASVAREEFRIVRAASVDQEAWEIDPELGIDLAWEGPLALALGLVSEQDSRIDPELGTARSSEIALGTAATDSAIVLISRTTAVTALKIAGIALKTARRTVGTDWRTAATDSKTEVTGSTTGAIG